MSTHILDVSGARALTTRTNDPASTYASTPAKQGDDLEVSIGAREIRLSLPDSARIQRRRYPTRRPVYDEAGKPIRDSDGWLMEDGEPEDRLVLVVQAMSIFARTSIADHSDERPVYESHPHSQVVAKRYGEKLHLYEQGELVEEIEVGQLAEAGVLTVEPTD